MTRRGSQQKSGPGVEINPRSEFTCCLFKKRLLVCSEGGRQELQHLTTHKKEHPQIEMTCKNRENKVISESLAKMIRLVQLPGQIGVPKSALQVRYVQTPKADTRSN
jgi:hypothetical protein